MKVRLNLMPLVALHFALLLAGSWSAGAAQTPASSAQTSPEQAQQERMTEDRTPELRALRDRLRAGDTWQTADAIAVVNESVLAEVARQFIGLEVTAPGGVLVRLTEITTEVRPATTFVRASAEAKSSLAGGAPITLRLAGRLVAGETREGRLRLPFQLTEVKVEGEGQSSLLRGVLGEWLTPERLNRLLPPIELPLDLSPTVQMPSRRFEVAGEVPMEITTPVYQLQMDFTAGETFFLDRRLIVALRLNAPSAAPGTGATSTTTATGQRETPPPPNAPTGREPAANESANAASDGTAANLEAEIARLAQNLTVEQGVRLRVSRRAINTALAQLVAAHAADFDVKLKPVRLPIRAMTGNKDAPKELDLEGGTSHLNVTRATLERLADNQMDLRIAAQGELDAKLRGRKLLFGYNVKPRGTFTLADAVLTLRLTDEAGRVALRAAPDARLPIRLQLHIAIPGRDMDVDRTVQAPVEQWLNQINFAPLASREWRAPRRLEAGLGGVRVTETQVRRLTFTALRATAANDALELSAAVNVVAP